MIPSIRQRWYSHGKEKSYLYILYVIVPVMCLCLCVSGKWYTKYFRYLQEYRNDAIISNNKPLFVDGSDSFQAHIILKTVQNGSNITVYVMALYEQYKKTGDKIDNTGGSQMPVAITFRKENSGNYTVTEYLKPEDGNRYTSSIQNKFPKDLWDKVETQFYAKALSANMMKQVQEHYK